MRTLFKVFFFLAAFVVLLSVLGGLGVAHEILSEPGVHITVNGSEWSGWDDPDIGDVIGAVFGFGVAGLVLFVVVPLVLLFAVGLPLLIVGGVVGLLVLIVGGLGAVVFSPAILLVLVLWMALRRPKPRMPAPAPRPDPRL